MSSTVQNSITRFDVSFSVATITRPANTTAYAIGDVIANVTDNNHFIFEDANNVGANALSGLISSARITSSANVSTKLDAELYLFYEDVTEVGDNVAWTPTDAELARRIGVIDFPTADWKVGNAGSDAAGNASCDVNNLGMTFKAASTSLFGVLIARNAYVPVSGEIFTIQLFINKD